MGQHLDPDDLTGNPSQPSGRHRDLEMAKGMALIPLGNRNRDRYEYGIDVVEDRGSDPNTWRGFSRT